MPSSGSRRLVCLQAFHGIYVGPSERAVDYNQNWYKFLDLGTKTCKKVAQHIDR